MMKIEALTGAYELWQGYYLLHNVKIKYGTFSSNKHPLYYCVTKYTRLPNVVKRQGASSRKVSHYWQCAIVAGKVPN